MVLIEPNGRPFIACSKCKQNIVWPKSLTSGEKREIALKIRSDSVNGMQFLQKKFGLDHREAKALALHITDGSGKCHRCSEEVSDEISICTKCKSANLNW